MPSQDYKECIAALNTHGVRYLVVGAHWSPSTRVRAASVECDGGEVVDTKKLDWKRIEPLIWW